MKRSSQESGKIIGGSLKTSSSKKKKTESSIKRSSRLHIHESREKTARVCRRKDKTRKTDVSLQLDRYGEEGVAPPTYLWDGDSVSSPQSSVSRSVSEKSEDSSPDFYGGACGDDSLLLLARGEFGSDTVPSRHRFQQNHRSGAELELLLRQQVEGQQTAPMLEEGAGDPTRDRLQDPYCGSGLLSRRAPGPAAAAGRGVLSSSRALVLDAAQAMGDRFAGDVEAQLSIPFRRAGGFTPDYLERRKEEMVQRFISDGIVLGGKRCTSPRTSPRTPPMCTATNAAARASRLRAALLPPSATVGGCSSSQPTAAAVIGACSDYNDCDGGLQRH